MLKAHFDALEKSILQKYTIPANSGHTLHKGTPREAFIREFLQSHLSERVAIGTGEIIDAQSQPNEARNQFDIVIYKRDYPKLDFGGGVNAFLAESVVATIEVKSLLDKKAMSQSIEAACNAKKLHRNLITSFEAGYLPPSILNYIVAYDGAVNIETIYKWIPKIHAKRGISIPNLDPDPNIRVNTSSPSIDGVFLLGKGFIYFDNIPDDFINTDIRAENPDMHWVIRNSPSGNLLLLFMFLTQAVSGISGSWIDPMPYLHPFDLKNTSYMP
ncbi:hypothetical protein PseudUWO311_22840 [Pseudanabaena sp. UWO311]|uniref:DUF6602 domain-containing protein n=1 Tax=Pseudanabaena sp. UWO311 TaxID=2487337 RepID=UPI0011583211|nr:DUF6602 domain-containing protein [Pseudanabaena sp. UWO311]TYQ23410.1 hypothetical protein PseudUWO311_22840 [Pseudanabaena sp. UWO311]